MERITKDPSKNYLETEPFFITDSATGEVHILRAVNEDIYGKTVKEVTA
jgi:hypothetical protein